MTVTPRKYQGKEGKTCSCILPPLAMIHTTYVPYVMARYAMLTYVANIVASWTGDHWSGVQSRIDKVTARRENRRKGRLCLRLPHHLFLAFSVPHIEPISEILLL